MLVSVAGQCRTSACFKQGAPTPRKRSPTGPASGELRFCSWRRAPDAAWQIPRSVSRRDLLSHLCPDVCALWPRNPWAAAPLLQHPPFPGPWCGPRNRTPYVPNAQTDGPMPMHECRPLSPPGCFRIRLRVPPSLSWRNIGACRPPGWRNTLSSRGSRVSMHRSARGQPSPSICSRNPERPVAARRETPF